MKKLQWANWSPSTGSPIPSIAFHDNGVQTVKVDVETVKSTSLLLRTAGGGEVKASSQIQRNTNTFQDSLSANLCITNFYFYATFDYGHGLLCSDMALHGVEISNYGVDS